MSKVIDLTKDKSGRKAKRPSSKHDRRRAERRPDKVFVVIHDKEPQDSGSDYRKSFFIASKEDTEIVGIYYKYKDACRAAEEYIRETFPTKDHVMEGYDPENPFEDIGWDDDGWLKYAELSYEGDDRVHVEEHSVH